MKLITPPTYWLLIEAGADDFLSKPFDHRVLKVRIAAGSRIVRLEQTLNQLASRDALTQCWNRRMIDELFTNSIAESTRKRSAFSIMVLDIDHFKAVNDTYGHAAGDVALKHVVVILLPSTDVNEAWGVAERVRSAIQFQPTVLNDDTKVDMTVSIGIAQFNRSRDINQNAFFERADKALYTAK